MFPYWVLFSAFAIAAVQTRPLNAQAFGRGPLLLLMALAVVLMMGLRYRVGGDWFNYMGIYQAIGDMDLGSALVFGQSDPAYSLINWVAHQIGVGIWFVNLIVSAVLIYGLMKFASDQPNPWLVFLVAVPYLIIVVGMGYTRQAGAIGLELLSLHYFAKGRIVQSLAFLAFAATFHKSAIIILPILGLSTTRNRLIIVPLAIVLGYLLYRSFIAERLDQMTSSYVTAQLESQGAGIRVGMNVIPALLFMRFSRRFGLAENERKLWFNMSIAALAAVAGLVLLSSSTVVDRLALYIIPLQLLVFGRLPSIFPRGMRTNGGLILAVIAYCAIVQAVWLTYATNARSWVPYRAYLVDETEET